MTAAAACRAVARGDLVLFAVLAVPGLGGRVLEWLVELNATLGLDGSLQMSASLLLLHLMGLMGCGLAWMRLRSEPVAHAVATTVCVKLGAVVLFTLFVWKGAPLLLALFGAVDAVQAATLLILLHKDRSRSTDAVHRT